MRLSRSRNASPLVIALGVLVAVVAIVGTRYFGWEWGSGQLVPTVIGVVAAAVAVVVFLKRRV